MTIFSKAKYYQSRISELGISGVLTFLSKKFLSELIWVIFSPIAITLHFLRFRILNVNTEAIGHLAGEIDALLKSIELSKIPRYRYILVRSHGGIANQALWNLWKTRIFVIENEIFSYLLASLSKHFFAKFDVEKYQQANNVSCEYYKILNEYQGLKLVNFDIPDYICDMGAEFLRKHGVPSGSPIICFHSRDGTYRPHVEFAHQHRNVNFATYRDAIKFCISQGYVCIRLGEPTEIENFKFEGFIDYATSPEKCDELDLFFCAKSKLFVGCTSGLFILASIFGTPCALANFIPLTAGAFSPNDLTIYKKYSDQDGRVIPFSQIFQLGLHDERISFNFENCGIKIIDNSPNEILNLVKDRLGFSRYTAEELKLVDDIYFHFRKNFSKGDYNFEMISKLSPNFIIDNVDLFRI